MKELIFKKIDAFTYNGSSGNGAGGIYLQREDSVSDEDMQKIATEMNGFVSEVVYIKESNLPEWNYNLRYFSCEREVPFCGHGTVAVMYDYLKKSAIKDKSIKIMTQKGILDVYNMLEEEDAVFITAPDPIFLDSNINRFELADVLGVKESDIADDATLTVVNAGQNTLLVKLKEINSCIEAAPDYGKIREFCIRNNIEVVNIYTSNTHFLENSYRTRVFAPTFGYLEDPATGSGNAALAYYLERSGLWDGKVFSIEQGKDKKLPNRIKIFYDRSKNRVVFGGSATVRIEGKYIL